MSVSGSGGGGGGVPKLQTPALLNQANPVSTTWYTVMSTKSNCVVIGISAHIDGGDANSTPLEIELTVDGQIFMFRQVTPGNLVGYFPIHWIGFGDLYQECTTTEPITRAYLMRGKTVSCRARITHTVAAPTVLAVKLRHALY